MNDKFKTDTAYWRDLEQLLNARAREGWLLAHIHSEPNPSGAWFVLVWWKPPEGMTVPLGMKVI